MTSSFEVDQIDHVELFVPDRHEAARWYAEVIGLRICEDYASWADDPRGPLMIATPTGGTKLALFVGTPQGNRETAGYHLVAFRVSGASFVRFSNALATLDLKNHLGEVVTREHVRDHGKAHSVYFCDPYGHRIEITTYDHDEVRAALSDRE